jgi:predicted DCC family thiol-disulfide oxidoreductase YuxK
MKKDQRNIILFDGVCNLCNGTVQFIIKRDTKIKFASLQSKSGQSLLKSFQLPTSDFQSIIYIKGDHYFTKSSALLNVMKELGRFWTLFYVLIAIPRPLRDFVYDLVAKSRFNIWGKRENCFIPTFELKQRFLE